LGREGEFFYENTRFLLGDLMKVIIFAAKISRILSPFSVIEKGLEDEFFDCNFGNGSHLFE